MPEQKAVKCKGKCEGPNHMKPSGMRDAQAKPMSPMDQSPNLGSLAKELKADQNESKSSTATTAMLLIVGAFFIYSVFYQ